MRNNKVYDFAVIGGGISSCVFVSSHINSGFNGKIAIIENGRNLGGRFSTRKSLANKNWQLNHGSPNFNIINSNNDELLRNFVQKLLDLEIIHTDTSELIEISERSNFNPNINSDFYRGTNYISSASMSEFSKNIIFHNYFKKQVDCFFDTLIVKLDYENSQWILTSKNGCKFITKFLICSSNLLLHKRSLNILNINQIPLRKAIPINKDIKIDKLLYLLNKQDYIQRLTFLIYTKSNYSYKDNYKNKFRYFILDNFLEEKYKFERIIFQKQKNNKLGIVLHTKNIDFINEYFKCVSKENFKKKLFNNFNDLFDNHNIINKLMDYQDISIMVWRASQPCGLAIPEYLQICEDHNIAFCGDWFDFEGFGRVEGAIISALNLSLKINLQY